MNLYQEAKNLIDEAGKILIVSHRRPDGDTLGAALAFKIYLERIGKSTVCACIDEPDDAFDFLPGIESFVDSFNLEDFDLMIIVDAGASYMTNFHLKYENFFESGLPIINIDHHASNDNFGTVNIVNADEASVTVMLYEIFSEWGVKICPDIATCLLTGIYNDTGSFMHSNTDERVFRIAADLMARGAKVKEISRAMFNTKSVETLRLWGKVMERANVNEDDVLVSILKEDDYGIAGPEKLTGVIDYLNMVPGTKFAVLISEDRKGNVKGSFRTRSDDVDLSRIAAVFGGGGHPKASGFSMPGSLQERICYEIVSEDMSKKSLKF